MPQLRGPIDYNRYPPRRRAAPSREAENAGDQAQDATLSEAGAFEHAASTRVAQDDGFAQARDSFQSEGENQAPRGGNRARARRREKLLRREAQRRGGAGLRVVSHRAPRNAARRRLWLRRARLIFFCFLLMGIGAGVYQAFTSPRMNIVEVQLDGAQITPREKIRFVQQLLVGRNWLRAPLGRAREELLALPTIRTAHVARDFASWPPRVLASIEERVPFARVGGGDEWFVVDESGVPFRRATEKDEALFAIASPLFRPREGVAFLPRNWKAARQLVNLLNLDANANWNLRRVYFDRHGFASIRLQGGEHDELLVQLGNEKWNEKLSRARRALAYFEASGRRASSLNLVSYQMPIWTPRATQKPRGASSQTAFFGAL